MGSIDNLHSIFCVIFLSTLMLFCHSIYASDPASRSTLVFKNFGADISLVPTTPVGITLAEPNSKTQYKTYMRADNGLRVHLSPRLIVKASLDIDRLLLLSAHQRIRDVNLLFQAADYHYFSVGLEDDVSLPIVMNTLSKIAGVLLVQPDLLLFREAHNASPSPMKSDFGSKRGRYSWRLSQKRYFNYLAQIGVPDLWRDNLGKGVRMVIIDDGFDVNHPHFFQMSTDFAFDLDTGRIGVSAQSGGVHGSKVMGVLLSSHFFFNSRTTLTMFSSLPLESEPFIDKSESLAGIAPETVFIGLKHTDTWTSKTLLSFQLAQLSDADIVNCSWNSPWLLEPVADAINTLSVSGRGGKGALVVFAAGNDGREIFSGTIEASLERAFVVGAHDSEGKRLNISNFGNSVDVYSYGGVALSTSAKGGYAKISGTSLAAAIVSGVAALLLAKNPELAATELEAQLLDRLNIFPEDV